MITTLTRARRRGFTIVETLITSVIIGISLMALGQLWTFAYHVTADTDDKAVAVNLARLSIEQIKETGFNNTPEGTTTTYYDVQQNVVSAGTAASRYQVVTSVTSSAVVPNSNPVQPDQAALRTVIATATLVTSGQVIFQTGTYLVRSGI